MTGSIDVLAPGQQTTVQDLGRFGHRHLGVGVAGALDTFSARVGIPDETVRDASRRFSLPASRICW